MTSHRLFVRMLASVFLAGEISDDQVIERASRMMDKSPSWLPVVGRAFVAEFATKRPRHREVLESLQRNPTLHRAWLKREQGFAVERWLTGPQPMRPIAAAANWELPAITSIGELAKWVGTSVGELHWFADLKDFDYRRAESKAAHYSYRALTKSSGSIRLIESPKSRLKDLQRRILMDLLDRVPPHQAAHGFIRGRSIKSFVQPHVNRRVVLRLDLSNFFPSLSGSRIQTVFRTFGYPEPVADLLGGICTNVVPWRVWRRKPDNVSGSQWREARDLYVRPHLPQGAPTSPALANICCYRIDCRLAGLAKAAGANYTRYADDLAFSGDEEFEGRVERFSNHVAAVLLEEGFAVNARKTRIMRQGVRQRLVGLVANRRMNVARADFDRLKAILTNCVRYGAASQNREQHLEFRSHLEGRINFVEMVHPEKGQRLRRIFEQISWDHS